MTAAQCVVVGLLVTVIAMYLTDYYLTRDHWEMLKRRRELREWQKRAGKKDE